MEKLLEYPIDGSEVIRKKRSLKRKLLENEPFITKKIALLSGSTIGEVANILELYFLRFGIKPEIFIGEYNCFYEDAVFPNRALDDFAPDIIYIHTTNKNIMELPDTFDSDDIANQKQANVMSSFKEVWRSLHEKYNCVIIQNNFEPMPYRLLGNNDAVIYSGTNAFIDRLNQDIYAYARQNDNFYVNDINYLASWYGLNKWFDDTQWYLYKYAMSVDAIALLCSSVAKIVKSLYGKNKKAIAVDLDNTLWGGVIGDDGVEGIELGVETPRGMAFLEFQLYLKRLNRTGIALNACSKNQLELAKGGFEHPSSVLHFEDFVCFMANWEQKSKNIATIAAQINILPESIVFLDDNPAERQIVLDNYPNMEVLTLETPENYLRLLDQSGYFEVTQLSEDDQHRNRYYKDNACRANEQSSFKNYADYLRTLKMCATIEEMTPVNMERIVQLINKTNQFNLTTARLSQREVELLRYNGGELFCTKLSDKYGDNGIVSVIAAQINGDVADIVLWVMSCRVFKRGLELAVFDELVARCMKRNICKLIGRYIPTAKNAFVENLYADLGFSKVKEQAGVTFWEKELGHTYDKKCTVMEVN